MIGTAVDEYGQLDILHNNAGIEGQVAKIVDQPVDGFDDVVNVNLKGVWLGMKYGVEAMLENESGGAIISTSSIGGLSGIPTYSVYGATKAGVSLMTKTVANEYAAENIRANAVAPGIVETEMVARVLEEDPEQEQAFLEMEPMPGLAQPEEIAKAVLFLGSDLASRVTGVTLPVEGGKLA